MKETQAEKTKSNVRIRLYRSLRTIRCELTWRKDIAKSARRRKSGVHTRKPARCPKRCMRFLQQSNKEESFIKVGRKKLDGDQIMTRSTLAIRRVQSVYVISSTLDILNNERVIRFDLLISDPLCIMKSDLSLL